MRTSGNGFSIPWHFTLHYEWTAGEYSPFFQGLRKKKLVSTACSCCKIRWASPRSLCLWCSHPVRWFELPMEGRVYSYTRSYLDHEAAGLKAPYDLILVEFDKIEGLLLSRLHGVKNLSDIRIGLPVELRFIKRPQGRPTDFYFVRK